MSVFALLVALCMKVYQFLYGLLDYFPQFVPLGRQCFLQFRSEYLCYASGEVDGRFGMAVMCHIACDEQAELFHQQCVYALVMAVAVDEGYQRCQKLVRLGLAVHFVYDVCGRQTVFGKECFFQRCRQHSFQKLS